MKKSLLALAVLGAFAGGAYAQSSVTLYGKIDQSFAKQVASKDKTIADNGGAGGSRFGLMGNEDLGNGLYALFRLEAGITPDTGAASTPFWNRYAYVGIGSKTYGQLTLGRVENGAWDVLNSVDPFGGDTAAALRDVGMTLRTTSYDNSTNASATNGTTLDVRRINNAARYDLSYQGFKFSASVAERPTTAAGDSINGDKKPWALGGSYTYGPAYVGLAYEHLGTDKGRLASIAAAYNFGFVKVSGGYSDGRDASDNAVKGFLIGALVPYGQFNFKAGYAQSKVESLVVDGNDNATLKKFGLGGEYKLSKRTKIYADYARIAGDITNDSIGDKNKNGYDIGIQHNF